ncbi:MAG: NfeD family protein [Blautia sp.]|nr:NfeD family protein [Blautia sp.]
MQMIWLGILAVFLIIEAITAGLTTIWFAGGALAAAVAALLGGNLVTQVILFLVVSLLLLVFTRPLAVKYMNRGLEKTNVNDLPGRTAVVTEEIDNLAQTGRLRINDIEWTARAEKDNVVIPAGAIVEITEVRGVKVIVKEMKEV